MKNRTLKQEAKKQTMVRANFCESTAKIARVL